MIKNIRNIEKKSCTKYNNSKEIVKKKRKPTRKKKAVSGHLFKTPVTLKVD